MKKLILLLIILLIIPVVSAENYMYREFSKTKLDYGEIFTITYKTSSDNIKFWAFEDKIKFALYPQGWDMTYVVGHIGGSCNRFLDTFQCYAASATPGLIDTEKILTLTAPNRDETLTFGGQWAITNIENNDVIKGEFDKVTVIVGKGGPEPPELCEWWEEYDEETGLCKIAAWVWLLLIILIFIILLRVIKRR